MLRRAGFANVFGDRQRYPETGIEELRARAPDVVMLSSEPFPFGEEHVAELAEQLPDARVVRVDAMPFSWYGSRLIEAPRYFRELRLQLAAN
jgi:ABC-type Fe3+-hydroxamate transport system substrate-binding protein